MSDSLPASISPHECKQVDALNALRRADDRFAAELTEHDESHESGDLRLAAELSRIHGALSALRAGQTEIKVAIGVIKTIVTERVDPVLALAQKQSVPPAPSSTPPGGVFYDLDGLGDDTRRDIVRPDRLARRAKTAERALTDKTTALDAAVERMRRIRVGRNWERAALGALAFVALAQQLGLWAALHRAIAALFGG